MTFENYFTLILKTKTEARILKLEQPIPENYITSMNEFLKMFFEDDPFEIKPNDLETYFTPTGKIKRLKFDRKPSTYLSIFRFLELYRQQLSSIKHDVNKLAGFYKKIGLSGSNEKELIELREKILTQLLSNGRLLMKWYPIAELLYKNLIQHLNSSLEESESNSGKGKGFINLRKIHSDSFLKNTFYPHYDSLTNFCVFCLAYSAKSKTAVDEFSQSLIHLIGS